MKNPFYKMIYMQDLNVESVFVGDMLCVGPGARGLGLGQQLLKRSMELAREKSCQVFFHQIFVLNILIIT